VERLGCFGEQETVFDGGHRPALTAHGRGSWKKYYRGVASREAGIASPTYHKWRQRYDRMSVDDTKELNELQIQNTKLKRLVAGAELEKMVLRNTTKENSKPSS
jgi:hypothetical protein